MSIDLRVLWLTENYPPQRGGMAVSCDRIVRSLREAGARVDAAHFSTRYSDWRIEQKINGLHFSCPVRDDIAHAMNRLWCLLEKENEQMRFSHVVAFGGLLPMTGGPVFAAWLHTPFVTLIRGNDFDAGIFSPKRGDILRVGLQASSRICSVSHDKIEKIAALYPQAKIEWTPNGIDLTDWEFTPEDTGLAQFWREKYVGHDQCVLGFFGQLKRKKGGLFFLETLLCSGRASRFHLLIVGDVEGEMLEMLETNKQELHFTTLPFMDRYELLPNYAACDMIVIPSFYDGLPNVLLEAAALGVPALASNAGGMRDVLVHNENALLFQAGDEQDLRRAIEAAANISREELERLGSNCKEMARKFNHQLEAERYLKILEETN